MPDGPAAAPDDGVDEVVPPASRAARLREVALLFLRLGFTAFGGPAAHVALMEDEVVHRRRWVTRERFLDLVALLNFVPGPNSTELAIHLGLIRAGFAGLVVAGLCFIVPAVLIILPIAWAYERYGALPRITGALVGINAGLIAVLAVASWRFSRSSVTGAFTAVVAVLAVAGMFLARRLDLPQAELLVLAAAATAGAARHWLASSRNVSLLLLPLSVAAPATAPSSHWLAELTFVFLKVGATLFGSGYVLVTYLHAELVDRRDWLTQRELLDAVAVGQVTPGPLLTTATFAGYVIGRRAAGSDAAGALGAVAATAAIFLPAFVFVALLGRWLPRLRERPAARGALDAANAAVAGLVVFITLTLAAQTLRDPLSLLIAGASFVALLGLKLNATWVMLAAAAAGLARAAWQIG